MSELKKYFLELENYSTKWEKYFDVYENLLSKYKIAEQVADSDELSNKINFDLNNLDFIKNENALKDINEFGNNVLKTTFNEVIKFKGQ